ncbi:MAG: hypothetical protein K0U41_05415 [Gammaproteobacteria bacterium]|nr:hypothetical protein [Gammaproteobacteria bacterium]
MAQTTFNSNIPEGIHGALAAVGGISDNITVLNGATAIPSGSVVTYDATGKLALGGAANAPKAGIALGNRSNQLTTGTDTYAAGSQVSVMKKGRIFVTLPAGNTAATVGGDVLYTVATGVITATASTSGAATTTPLTNATFETAGSAGDLVVVRLDN